MNSEFSRRTLLKGIAATGAMGATQIAAAEEPKPAAAPAPPELPDLKRIHDLIQGNQKIKWIFAGDSITHGARHVYGSRDYPQLFEERLRYEMGQEANLVIRTATSGWTLKGIDQDLDWRVLQFAPSVLSIHIGMNDCSGGDAGLDDFKTRYIDLIGRVRKACNAAIIVHTPNGIIAGLDPKREPFLPKYVAVAREVATSQQCILVDHYQGWADYQNGGGNPFYLMNDAIHPNEAGHRYKAHLLFKALGIWDPESSMCRLYVPR